MKKPALCVLAVLATAVSTSAVAKDLKQDKKATTPAVSATQMNGAEMDKVTAGAASHCAHRGCIGGPDSFPGPSWAQHTTSHGRWVP
jgi:hypothetical protein